MDIKFYSTKANAKRAAKANGLNLDELQLIEENGQYAYVNAVSYESAANSTETQVTLPTETLPQDEIIDLAAQQKLADKVANNAILENPETVVGTNAILHQSTINRPCKQVFWVADEMKAANPKVTRSEVINECVKRGIAYYTARTQYQQWFAVQREMAEREAKSKTK